MKISKFILLNIIIILVMVKCDDDDDSITGLPPGGGSIAYISSFHGLNDGENKRSVNVSWEEYTGSDFESYIITDLIDTPLETITSQSTTTTTIGLGLNEIKTLKLKLNGNEEEEAQIQVFTRDVMPVSNLTVQGNEVDNTKIISWTASTDDDINQIVLYKASTSSQTLPLIEDNNGTPSPIWTEIESSTSSLFNSYTDNNINSSYKYFYIVKVVDSNDGYRYSYVASNFEDMIAAESVAGSSGGILDMNFSIGSNENFDHTSFGWTSYDYDDFHELQIWRSDGEQSDFNIDDGEGTLVIKTSDQTMNNFQDYTVIENGEYPYRKTWHYKIRIYNTYGNYADSNTITCQTGL